ncbi:putative cytochrome P450 [Microthyrium microscopicum]|uniref:Putative cytochrome P450 n=1 Tax=Microthyrium microscopicum TaxID=703497 RepID=A0A6A6U8H0_9PEZI|nr:putative cytochrome P450 [Microthyrium microscopicum]
MAEVIHPGWNIDNSAAVVSDDPEKIYKEWDYMRSQCPVAHVNRHDGYWILTKHEDIKNCALDSDTFISSVCAIVPSDPRGIRRPPLKFDGKDHTPYRTALDRTLKASRLKRLEPVLQKHCDDELQPLLDRGEGDICQEFASNFCGWVESVWLNLDPKNGKMLADSVNPFVQSWRTGDWDGVKRGSEAFYVIARDVIADRQKALRDPEEDPASSLILERDSEGKPLDEFHLVGCIRQSLIVSMVAPPILISAMTNHLSKDKELQNQLRNNPELQNAAIEEFVRLYTPYRGFARTATHDVEISGQAIPQDEPMTMTYAAGNRDPSVFSEPDKFILNRPNITAHLGFGKGRHRCAGMPLARMILKVFLRTILEKTTDWDVNSNALHYARLPEIGIIGCPTKFHTKMA